MLYTCHITDATLWHVYTNVILFIHYVHTYCFYAYCTHSAETFLLLHRKISVTKYHQAVNCVRFKMLARVFGCFSCSECCVQGRGYSISLRRLFWCIRAWQYTIFYYNETGYRSVSDTPKNSPLLCAFRRGGGRGEGVYAYVVGWSDLWYKKIGHLSCCAKLFSDPNFNILSWRRASDNFKLLP